MDETAVLTMVDGVQVVVPDSLDLITPYVLREQHDFFEDELRFVRLLLQPGQQAVDIGANYGVYTLSIARRVGPGGHVWAFEPASSTAQLLAQSLATNSFEHVTLEQKAVSNTAGSAQLSLQRHAELNSIIHGQPPAGKSETVSLVTLDECRQRYGWASIEFVKIDAEGEESNIVKGGRRFFTELAPLVQYELRTTAAMNLELIREFAQLGYDSYRLVPGLDLLVPFDSGAQPDPYLLNLFCCNAERAQRLAARGVLLRSAGASNSNHGDSLENYHWRRALAHLPYAAQHFPAWGKAEEAGNAGGVIHALSLYARSRDPAQSPENRFLALQSSFMAFKALCEGDPARLRLASLARVAHDYGERAISVAALKQLLSYIHHAGVDPSEPFLPPLERFDQISPGEQPTLWLIATVLEQLERREYFSSFYAGPAARERLQDIHALGYGSPEMERRLNLLRLRFDRTHRT
jgi:FkbM family methyltransferase